MATAGAPAVPGSRLQPGPTLVATFLIGIGIVAAIDEIVLHQLLGWHHFYDGSTRDVALASDGMLHAAELVLVVGGFFLVADLRRRGTFAVRHAWAGVLLGMGTFQLFDGVVHHKLLGLHQIRYDVDLLPYDVVWFVVAVVLLAAGGALLASARRRER